MTDRECERVQRVALELEMVATLMYESEVVTSSPSLREIASTIRGNAADLLLLADEREAP